MAQGWQGSYTRYKGFFLNISELYKKRLDLRSFLEVILSLFTIIIFLLFALKPTAITIINLLQQIKEKKATLSSLSQKVTDLQTVQGIIQKNQNNIENIDISIPSLPNPDVLSKQIEGIASKNSVSVVDITINPIPLVGKLENKTTLKEIKALPEGLNDMSFSTSIGGKFVNLISFLRDMENMRIAVKIDRLGITSSTEENGVVVITMLISGRVPYIGK